MCVKIENISVQVQKRVIVKNKRRGTKYLLLKMKQKEEVKNKRRGTKYLLLKMKQKEEGLKNYPKQLVW
jgi:hypothetical protein